VRGAVDFAARPGSETAVLTGGGADQEQTIPLGPGVDEPLAWKPKLAVAPGARSGAQVGAVMVQALPLVVMVELQALVSVTPDGTVHLIVQLCQVLAVLLVTVTFALNPPGQELAML
jgi:hypothetical protein